MTRRLSPALVAVVAGAIIVAACTSSPSERTSTSADSTEQATTDTPAGSTAPVATTGDTSADASVVSTSVVPPETTSSVAEAVSDEQAAIDDDELLVGLMLSDTAVGQRSTEALGVAAGAANQAISQVDVGFLRPEGEFGAAPFVISANGDLSTSDAVYVDSFVELLESRVDLLVAPDFGIDVGELTDLAANTSSALLVPSYVNDGTVPTQGVRFDIAGSLDAQVALVVAEVTAGDFDSIVVLGSAGDDLGERFDDAFDRNGSDAAFASVPSSGDRGDIIRLAAEIADRGERIAVVVATAASAIDMVDAVIAQSPAVTVFATETTLSLNAVSSMAPFGEGQLVVVSRANDVSRPEQVALLERLRLNNPDLVRPLDAAEVYDMYVLAALAAVESGVASGESVRDRVIELSRDGEPCSDLVVCFGYVRAGVDIDYDGVSGPIEFDDDGVATQVWLAVGVADPSTRGVVTSEYVLQEI